MPNYKSNCKVIGNSITVTVIDPALLAANCNVNFGLADRPCVAMQYGVK